MTAERQHLIVALAIKNCTHPRKNNFPAFVRKILAAKHQVDADTAKKETETARQAFNCDKWQSIIQNLNGNFTQEEIEKWEQSWSHAGCLT